MFFLAGIAGQVGGSTARHHLQRGRKICAALRDLAAGISAKGRKA